MNLPESGAAFDRVAATYDADSTNVPLSRWLRAQLWERLAALFPPDSYLLELGCGTGEDAVWLAQRGVRVLTTDISPQMLALTAQKAAQHGVAHLIETRPLDFAHAESWTLPANAFDGVYSNYGALNCTKDWAVLGNVLACAIRLDGYAAFSVIGRFSLWETLWHAAHAKFRTAARRWRGESTAQIGGVAFPIYYPTARQFRKAFGAAWRLQTLHGWGVFLPPSDVYRALERRPRLMHLLCALERRFAHLPISAYLADHFWLALRRTGG